ncbi:hypothetical protein [Hyphococcus sp.]|uniref:hypothetical protein n=1 Tax=Hyphococcus sp. TaxID=2038636 RepID=UPI0035C72897
MGKQFWNGVQFSGAIFGFVSAVIAVFNFVISKYSLPLSPVLEPIIKIYRQIFGYVFQFIDVRADWAIPDWSTDRIILTAIAAGLWGRITVLNLIDEGDKSEYNPITTFLGPLFIVFMSVCVPYVRAAFQVMVWVTPLLLVMGTFYKVYRKAAIYLWGIVAGTAFALFVNYWYG